MGKKAPAGSAPWLTAMAEHEGFPLALRVRPSADNRVNRTAFGLLAVVTHELDEVTENGLPAARYNDSLADFDHELHDALEYGRRGLIVIVETFAGKRNYYAYVSDEKELLKRFAAVSKKFPQHRLSVECEADPKWRFYDRYREQYPW